MKSPGTGPQLRAAREAETQVLSLPRPLRPCLGCNGSGGRPTGEGWYGPGRGDPSGGRDRDTGRFEDDPGG